MYLGLCWSEWQRVRDKIPKDFNLDLEIFFQHMCPDDKLTALEAHFNLAVSLVVATMTGARASGDIQLIPLWIECQGEGGCVMAIGKDDC